MRSVGARYGQRQSGCALPKVAGGVGGVRLRQRRWCVHATTQVSGWWGRRQWMRREWWKDGSSDDHCGGHCFGWKTVGLDFSSCLFLIARLLYYPVGSCLLLLLVVSLDRGLGLFDHLSVPQRAFSDGFLQKTLLFFLSTRV